MSLPENSADTLLAAARALDDARDRLTSWHNAENELAAGRGDLVGMTPARCDALESVAMLSLELAGVTALLAIATELRSVARATYNAGGV